MPKARTPKIARAAQGEKMIEVKLRFWTNNISSEAGNVLAKHAWSSGVVRMERNASHGISPKAPRPFHSLLDVGAVIERVLIDHDIALHPSPRLKKYLSE
jgi:hypothetical protein